MENPKHRRKAEEIARQEKLEYSNEQLVKKNQRKLKAETEKIRIQRNEEQIKQILD